VGRAASTIDLILSLYEGSRSWSTLHIFSWKLTVGPLLLFDISVDVHDILDVGIARLAIATLLLLSQRMVILFTLIARCNDSTKVEVLSSE